jgi:hypothetical protein
MDQWFADVAKTIASQGPLFTCLVAFIVLLGSGRLIWLRELERERKVHEDARVRDRELYAEEKAENAKLRELIATFAATATVTISRVERMLDKLER